jgi:hypothetical protein
MTKESRFKEKSNNTKENLNYLKGLEEYFKKSLGTNVEKLQNFTKYVPRQDLTNFLARYELFKKILHVPGDIIDCGVLFGGNLMAFAQFSAIFEHTNLMRKIIGFDTFSGFPKLTEEDGRRSEFARKGGFAINSYNDLQECIKLYDSNRFLNHIPKIELIRGDATKTIPKYIKDNPATVVSLLYVDFVLYEPTKIALKHFVPRMPKGAIIAFNLLSDNMHWPGTTKAVLDTIGINNLKIRKFSFTPYSQYIVL